MIKVSPQDNSAVTRIIERDWKTCLLLSQGDRHQLADLIVDEFEKETNAPRYGGARSRSTVEERVTQRAEKELATFQAKRGRTKRFLPIIIGAAIAWIVGKVLDYLWDRYHSGKENG